MEFSKKAYLLRAVKAARKTLDITCYVQSGFPIKWKIDEKTGLDMTMKIITKRHGKPNPIKDAEILLKTINRLRKRALIPKGVYRFSSPEEADQWMMRQIVSTHARLKSKT